MKEELWGSDFGNSCAEQASIMCGDGRFRVATTYDRADPEGPPVRQRQYCMGVDVDGELPEGIDRDDFVRAMPLPEPILSDHDGLGIRNAETNFYTTTQERTVPFDMSGTAVEITLVPESFTWDFGDGSAELVTDDPGGPAPEFDTPTVSSHVYEETGVFDVKLSTEFSAVFLVVDTGEVLPFEGRVRMDSPMASADIWRPVSRGVDEDCRENPAGWGCDSLFLNED